MADLAALVQVRVGMLYAVVAVRMSMEITSVPANQESKRKNDDDDANRRLCSPYQHFREVPPEEHYR
jgi:hypothetical protein